MERTKRCFICGAKEDKDGHCTNSECPRAVVKVGEEKFNTATNKGMA